MQREINGQTVLQAIVYTYAYTRNCSASRTIFWNFETQIFVSLRFIECSKTCISRTKMGRLCYAPKVSNSRIWAASSERFRPRDFHGMNMPKGCVISYLRPSTWTLLHVGVFSCSTGAVTFVMILSRKKSDDDVRCFLCDDTHVTTTGGRLTPDARYRARCISTRDARRETPFLVYLQEKERELRDARRRQRRLQSLQPQSSSTMRFNVVVNEKTRLPWMISEDWYHHDVTPGLFRYWSITKSRAIKSYIDKSLQCKACINQHYWGLTTRDILTL